MSANEEVENKQTEIDSIIKTIKRAINRAELQTADAPLTVSELELTLQAYTKKLIGGGFKWNIFEIGMDHSKEETQTIQVTLEPSLVAQTAMLGGEDLEANLVNSIVEVKQCMQAAADEPPVFKLKDAVVTLNFVVDTSGTVSLVVKGEGDVKTTHELKLTIKPAAPSTPSTNA